METLDSLLLGFSVAFRPDVLWYAFLGCLVVTLVGELPGIGPLSGISILLPVTFGLNATQAVIMLAGSAAPVNLTCRSAFMISYMSI